MISECLNFKNVLGENIPDPIAVYAPVHVKNTQTKRSQYKHFRKGDFLPEKAPENDLGLLQFQKSPGGKVPRPA